LRLAKLINGDMDCGPEESLTRISMRSMNHWEVLGNAGVRDAARLASSRDLVQARRNFPSMRIQSAFRADRQSGWILSNFGTLQDLWFLFRQGVGIDLACLK
jgi:hypothetical protein